MCASAVVIKIDVLSTVKQSFSVWNGTPPLDHSVFWHIAPSGKAPPLPRM